MDELRKEIDKVDKIIQELLNKRFNLTKEIGKLKLNNNQKVFDNKRETIIFNKIEESNINNKEEVIKVYKTIIECSKLQQKEIKCKDMD